LAILANLIFGFSLAITNEETKTTNQPTGEVKKKKSGWGKFFTFLAYGGWLVILIVIMGIVIAVTLLTQ
jgi:hypothetical protein